jgi:YidC/Oxa1 family membrane protein insertase
VIGANAISPIFQTLLNGIGEVLAFLYRVIPSYAIDVILLTLLIRLVLLPLGIKQIRSMQAMQSIQPEMKKIQAKYKGRRDVASRTQMNEEMKKLYDKHGVNPLSGCLPLLLQFPILITLFYVLQFPKGMTHIPHSNANPVVGQPQDSRLYVDIVHQKTTFLGMNLLCSAREAGTTVQVRPKSVKPSDFIVPDAPQSLDCGKGGAIRIPFYLFLAAMIGTTYYQQRQMQRASPAQNPQQQMLTRIMPLFFGFIGFNFPAGLVIYWTTTNLVQIGQQHFMLPRMKETSAAKATGDGATAAGKGPSARPRSSRPGEQRPRRPIAGQPEARNREQQGTSPEGTSATGRGSGGGSVRGAGGARRPGGSNGGSRKKRRKR